METPWISLFLVFFLGVVILLLHCCFAGNSRRLRKQNLELRQERETIFDFVHNIGEVFADAEAMDTNTLLSRILFFAATTGKAASGAIYLMDTERNLLFAHAVSGLFPPLYDTSEVHAGEILSKSAYIESLVKSRPVAPGEGLIGNAASVGSGVLIEDAEIDSRVPVYSEDFLSIRTLLIVPMRFGNEVLGVIALINRTDEKQFTSADFNLLQSMADQASVPVHYADLKAALEQKRQMDRGMQAARQIQSSLLPQALPDLSGVKLEAYNVPAMDIGGDYFDFIRIGEDLLGIAIADVSGKGIGGAMMMAVCQGVLRAHAPLQQSPAKMLSELNRVLSANLAEDMFITMLYLVLNTRTRELVFARAGHERPLLSRKGNGRPGALNASGIAIGLADAEIFDTAIHDVSVPLQSGDIVVVYTDGITEALNSENEEWGLDRLCEIIQAESPKGVRALTQSIRERLSQYVGAQQQYDDMTLLAFEID